VLEVAETEDAGCFKVFALIGAEMHTLKVTLVPCDLCLRNKYVAVELDYRLNFFELNKILIVPKVNDKMFISFALWCRRGKFISTYQRVLEQMVRSKPLC